MELNYVYSKVVFLDGNDASTATTDLYDVNPSTNKNAKPVLKDTSINNVDYIKFKTYVVEFDINDDVYSLSSVTVK